MGWFDEVMTVANPVAYLANGGASTSKYIPGNGDASATPTYLSGSNAADREKDLEAGYAKGKEIFYDDPEMQQLKKRREDLAKGYSGEELGAIRATARGEIAGQRNTDQRKLASNLARGGVGGARGAAIRGAADQKYAGQAADAERKMALDSAGMARSGANDLQDFVFRQKYGALGTGLGYGQLGVSDRTAEAQAAINNQQGQKGLLGGILDGIF
jgi:hypothetical protein